MKHGWPFLLSSVSGAIDNQVHISSLDTVVAPLLRAFKVPSCLLECRQHCTLTHYLWCARFPNPFLLRVVSVTSRILLVPPVSLSFLCDICAVCLIKGCFQLSLWLCASFKSKGAWHVACVGLAGI